ncbi:hypothetical protein MKW92_019652 [Papaver armeniacum]|nr:hypothetical protein MKW92_019652 [Papaver armeniacum]
MATDSREELRRLQNVILKLSAEIGGKNQKLEYFGEKLKEGSTALSEMKEQTDHLNQSYKEEKIKVKMTVLENQRLEREIETQRREIEQQVKEIKKRDTQLDFKNKQILVLRMLQNAPQKVNTVQGRDEGVENMSSRDMVQLQIAANGLHQAPQKVNTVQGRHEGVQNMSSLDKVQVRIDTNGLHNELGEEKDHELNRQKQTLGDKEHRSCHDVQEAHKVSIEVQNDTNGLHNEEKDYELSQKQTLVDKQHRSNHDPQEARKVPIEEIGEEDDEKSVEILDDWRIEDCDFSEEEECNSFEDTFPPIPPPESSVDPCNDMQTNSSDISSVLPVPEDKKGDECGKGDIQGGGGVETVECNAFEDMFPPIAPPEPLVDPCSDMPNNCLDFSFVLPDPDCDMTDMEWLSTFVDDSMSAGDITMGIDFSDNNKNDDSATVLQNSSSSCSGGMTMPLSTDTVVLDLYGASAHDQQFSVNNPLQI